MKKQFAWAAAAILLSAGSAVAGSKTSSISLDGTCVVASVTVSKIYVAANENDECGTLLGEGFISKVKGLGTVAAIGGETSELPGYVATIALQYPFKTGNAWNLYYTTDGVNMVFASSGTYTVNGAGFHAPKGAPTLRDLIKH
jgi:hypothetical protein